MDDTILDLGADVRQVIMTVLDRYPELDPELIVGMLHCIANEMVIEHGLREEQV